MRSQNRSYGIKNKLFDELCPNCNLKHRKDDCAAKESTCYNCNKKGHWKNSCRGMKNKTAASVLAHLCSSRTNEKHGKLSKIIIKVGINGGVCVGLIDTGATECFIDAALENRLKLKRHRVLSQV